MDEQTVRTLFEYHYALFDRIWEIADSLTTEQFVAESDYSLRSVRNHLVHCMNVDDRWLSRLKGTKVAALLEEEDFPDQGSVRTHWDAVRERVLAYVHALSAADLAEEIVIDLPHRFPVPGRFTRYEIIMHMVNHGTDHRAQILARLHELGATTIEQDMVLHWWEEGG